MKFTENISNDSLLLNEITSLRDDDIKKAINNMLRVRISYDDKKKHPIKHNGKIIPPNKGKKERYICPVAFGVTKKGNRAVRAYQRSGSTKRGVPHWKLFLVDNIFNWSNTRRSFKDEAQHLIDKGLNMDGIDKGLGNLMAVSPITGKIIPSTPNNSLPIDSEPITKTDITPSVKPPKSIPTSKAVAITQTKKQNVVDKPEDNRYTVSKVNAPDTKPITKGEIQTFQKPEMDTEVEPTVAQTPTTEPITKDDVTGGETLTNNKLTNTFKDLTQRMDNLYKDNDEEEKEN
jgi:hypothetical protein